MTIPTEDATTGAIDERTGPMGAAKNFYSGITSAQEASENFVVSMKDLYQELKNAPTRRANIRQ